MKKIFILYGHPEHESFGSTLAESYEKGARQAGFEVQIMKMADMQFDPCMMKEMKKPGMLEPDLKLFQEHIVWCDHFVVQHPIWWNDLPARLKGLFDRTFYQGFAYKYGASGYTWSKLLKGRTGRIIYTCGSPWFVSFFRVFGSPTQTLKTAILNFCGIKTKATRVARAEKLTEEQKNAWRGKMFEMGMNGK